MTPIQQQMLDLQRLVIRNDYYMDIYWNCLYTNSMTTGAVVLGMYDDEKIVEFANDFWLALPDDPAIRRDPFFLLCDIAEHCFDDCADESVEYGY